MGSIYGERVFWGRLENPYDDEEDAGPITIQFTDTSPSTPDMNSDTRITDTTKQDLDYTTNLGHSLNNICNIDPDSDHITIRITGVNDQLPNNSTIEEDRQRISMMIEMI